MTFEEVQIPGRARSITGLLGCGGCVGRLSHLKCQRLGFDGRLELKITGYGVGGCPRDQ
jgi:hypothetical protein